MKMVRSEAKQHKKKELPERFYHLSRSKSIPGKFLIFCNTHAVPNVVLVQKVAGLLQSNIQGHHPPKAVSSGTKATYGFYFFFRQIL
jgi:hypothetical protein